MQDYKYTDRERTQDLEFILDRLDTIHGDAKYVQELIHDALINHKSLKEGTLLPAMEEQMKKLRELIDEDITQIQLVYNIEEKA